tara:strand:+ start:252 stop:809 length:558 start_codon:yes stop_codon:yes gene_type:complete
MSKQKSIKNNNNIKNNKNNKKGGKSKTNVGGGKTFPSMFLNIINTSVNSLNSNKFFAGLIMIILNIGSKFITIKFSKTQEAYLRNTLGRQILIFAIAFMGTKDIYLSLVITAVFVILANYLLNEESKFCIMPKKMKEIKNALDTNGDGEISEDEIQDALDILNKAKEQKTEKKQALVNETFKSKK